MWDAVVKLLSEDKLIAGVLLALLGFAGSSQALMVWLVKRTADALDGFRKEMHEDNIARTEVVRQNTAVMAVMNHIADEVADAIGKCRGPKGDPGEPGQQGIPGIRGPKGEDR